MKGGVKGQGGREGGTDYGERGGGERALVNVAPHSTCEVCCECYLLI